MNTGMADIDPLSTYDYNYGAFGPIPNVNPNGYPFNIKLEPMVMNPFFSNNPNNSAINAYTDDSKNQTESDSKHIIEEFGENTKETSVTNNVDEPEDNKEDLKPLIAKQRRKRGERRGKTSSYWSKKITDADFPFYGCTICDISFKTIQELDQHVTVHKGRPTSYDLKLKNQLKKKLLKKEKKKLKKLSKKVKQEKCDGEFAIEIKPEDGYIGNEKASDFNKTSVNVTIEKVNEPLTTANESMNNENNASNNQEAPKDSENENSNQIEKSNDPRLEKLFKCFACKKQFSLGYYLKLHVRSHTDEKPYTCAECGQSFITASKLGRHNKRIHLAIKYQCRICYRFFSRFEYLTRHFDKKHPDDKLEGEPYDYNAILPYLKELEEQIREKVEETKAETKTETKEEKPKTEELWTNWSGMDRLHQSFVDQHPGVGPDQPQRLMTQAELLKKQGERLMNDDDIKEDEMDTCETKLFIEVEEVKDEVQVKVEKIEGFDVKNEELKNEDLKDESFSDEDYFPVNTWACTPKIEMSTSPPPPTKRRPKSSEYPLKCDLCDKVINSASYMKVHLRTHTGERPFKCYICQRGFITSSKMHRHVLTHSESLAEDEPEIKVEGDVKVKSEKGGDENTETKKGSKKLKGKANKKLKDGARKKKKQYQKRPFACDFCNKRFLHKDTMQVHMKSHDGEVLVLKCKFCLEVMADDEALKTHEATHVGPRPYLCTICGRKYTKKETMVYHRKTHSSNTPSDKKEFICDICSKTFNAQCKLQRHIVSHRVDKFVLRYECPVCAHMFNTKYHVQMHLATHQKEGLILEENRSDILAMVLQNARKIPKKSDAPVNLSDLIPADERSRVCNICGQVFQHFYYLEEHLKSHGSLIAVEDDMKSEERKHICPVCHKGFKLHYYLKLHSFTHTKEKPYICQQCGKGFITKGKLKRHLETHAGLKKYQCHICCKFFTRPSYLRIHVRTIHGTQDYNFRLDKQYEMPLSHQSYDSV